MKILRSTEIKVIGAFFLVGGLFGFFTFIRMIFPLGDLVSFLYLLPTLLFALTLYSGYLLLLKENEKGLEIGRAVIAMQIIHFHIAGIGYLFITGGYIFLGFTNLNVGLNAGLENTFLINISEETDNVVFRVNILALSVFLYLTRTMNKIHDEREMQESLGNERSNSDH